jgi:hypothetical protein
MFCTSRTSWAPLRTSSRGLQRAKRALVGPNSRRCENFARQPHPRKCKLSCWVSGVRCRRAGRGKPLRVQLMRPTHEVISTAWRASARVKKRAFIWMVSGIAAVRGSFRRARPTQAERVKERPSLSTGSAPTIVLRRAETPSLGYGRSAARPILPRRRGARPKGREPPNRQLSEALRRAQPGDLTSALVRT